MPTVSASLRTATERAWGPAPTWRPAAPGFGAARPLACATSNTQRALRRTRRPRQCRRRDHAHTEPMPGRSLTVTASPWESSPRCLRRHPYSAATRTTPYCGISPSRASQRGDGSPGATSRIPVIRSVRMRTACSTHVVVSRSTAPVVATEQNRPRATNRRVRVLVVARIIMVPCRRGGAASRACDSQGARRCTARKVIAAAERWWRGCRR